MRSTPLWQATLIDGSLTTVDLSDGVSRLIELGEQVAGEAIVVGDVMMRRR
jgi:hypothetical protein